MKYIANVAIQPLKLSYANEWIKSVLTGISYQMATEQLPKTALEATLQLLGKEAVNCLLTHVSKRDLLIQADPANINNANTNDLAEIHIAEPTGSGTATLKIQGQIDAVSHGNLRLRFLNADDAAVKRLSHWFASAGPAVNTQPSSGPNIINTINQLILKQLPCFIEFFLKEADRQLLALAEKARSNEQQAAVFSAKATLKNNQDLTSQLICQFINQQLAQPSSIKPTTVTQAETHAEDIELVDLNEFEDWLSLEVIVKRSNAQYQKPIACLCQRYGSLIQQTLDEETLPFGITSLCRALQYALKECKVAPELLPEMYQVFEYTTLKHIGDLYDSLNAKLKSYGILPNLEATLHRQTARRARQPDRHTAATDRHSTDEQQTAPEQHSNNVIELPRSQHLFNAAKEVLNLSRQPSTETSAAENVVYLSRDELVNSLSQLQQDNSANDLCHQQGTVTDWLTAHNEKALAPEVTDLIELTGTLFHNLNVYTHISNSLVEIIQRLQIPITKTAVLDKDFFDTEDHPAHQLMNQLVDLCLNSDMPNPALESTVTEVVDRINDSDKPDRPVYEQAIDALSAISQQQSRAAKRNLERISQTYEGQQQLKRANHAVDREIQRRITAPSAPDVVIALIEKGWKELLKLSYIKHGPDDPGWHEQLALLDQLLARLTDEEHSLTGAEREQEANRIADFINQQLNDTFPGDYQHQAIVEKIRAVLAGKEAVEFTDINDNSALIPRNPNELHQQLELANPELSRWFKRAKAFKAGDEFSYLNKESEHHHLKLAWVDEDHQHFVFANQRGQKVFDFDLVDLAKELDNGLYPSAKQQPEWPLVESSLYSTVQKAYQQLEYNSSHDELTGLINRKECERLLDQHLKDIKKNARKHCLLYIDIDQFSLTNNLYGHIAGDKILEELSQLFTQHLAKSALAARMGGNEFVILIEDRTEQDGMKAAEAIRTSVEDFSFQWQDNSIRLTASIGLIGINKYTESVVDLIRNAISACKTAKESGGNRCYNFHSDSEIHLRREKLLSWINKLNSILDNDQLVLRGQPIQSINANGHCHYEILLAIKEDDGSLISPAEFIEAAECYNRMQRIDQWVIEHTFEWLHNLQNNGSELPFIAINLSANSINDDHLMEFLLDKFAQYKIPTRKICFEVTETATIANLAFAADFIREIKKIGCKFSLDDFGSGNSSYQYLKHLPVDYLKIDGAFIKDINNSPDDYALVKSINEIAHLMGKETIAEYTESSAVLETLKTIGVDYVQGFEIGEPRLIEHIAG